MTAAEGRPVSPLDGVTLRPLTSGDQAFLWTVLYHAIHVEPGAPPPDPSVVHRPEVARYVRGWGRATDRGVLAEREGVPLGAAWLRRWTRAEPGYGFVDEATPELSMAVLPGWRGRGLGTRLLAETLAGAPGAVSLSVSASNPARRLYERAGFVAISADDSGALTLVRRPDQLGSV